MNQSNALTLTFLQTTSVKYIPLHSRLFRSEESAIDLRALMDPAVGNAQGLIRLKFIAHFPSHSRLTRFGINCTTIRHCTMGSFRTSLGVKNILAVLCHICMFCSKLRIFIFIYLSRTFFLGKVSNSV